MSDDQRFVVRVERHVGASADAVFALLSDPRRHPDIDGSGTVLRVKASRTPLAVGSHFDMHMRRGFSYSTRNEVVELAPGRRISWRTRPLTPPLRWLIGGRTWTYDLAPDPAGGTLVTETWDLRDERNRSYVAKKAGDPTADMEATLERIDRLTAAAR